MKGAIVFLVVFAILVVITLGNTNIPPGKLIYDRVLPNTEAASGYLIGGTIDADRGVQRSHLQIHCLANIHIANDW